MTQPGRPASRQTLALNHDTPPADVHGAFANLGFERVAEDGGQGGARVSSETYQPPNRSMQLVYARDPHVQIDTVDIQAATWRETDNLRRALHPPLELFNVYDLLDFARKDDELARSFGLRGLAATLLAENGIVIIALRDALADARRAIRFTAGLCIARLAWPMLEPIVAARAAIEPDAELRARFTELAATLRELKARP